MAEVSRAVVEVLHAGCADFFKVSWTQWQIIESIRSRVTDIIQEQRISDTFDTQFPMWWWWGGKKKKKKKTQNNILSIIYEIAVLLFYLFI